MLGKEAVESFQEIYKQKFGKELSVRDAAEQGSNLIRLYRLVLSETQGDKFDDTKDDR